MIFDTVVKYIVTACCALVIGILSGAVKKMWSEQKALKKGTQSLLRADIIRSYEKYMEKGYCPIYARDALAQEYEAYHGLGQNGTVSGLFERVMELPTEVKK